MIFPLLAPAPGLLHLIDKRRKQMDIKILALDLDGTLLTDHNHVSAACRDAVQAARKKGIQAVICTGRNAAD